MDQYCTRTTGWCPKPVVNHPIPQVGHKLERFLPKLLGHVRTVHSPKKLVSAEGLSQLPAPAPSVEAALCCVGFEKDWRRRSERRHLQAVAAQPGNTRTVLQKPGPYTMPYRPYQQRPNITISWDYAMMASLGRKLTSNFQQFQHPFKHKQPTKKLLLSRSTQPFP